MSEYQIKVSWVGEGEMPANLRKCVDVIHDRGEVMWFVTPPRSGEIISYGNDEFAEVVEIHHSPARAGMGGSWVVAFIGPMSDD